MRRSPSEDLFRLIKSLHKGEKRNFKLLTGLLAGGRDKKYITLFDLIDRQDNYNEAKLVKHFGDLYGGQFSAGKNYLYKFILKSLVYFESDSDSELATLKAQVGVLARKELYPQARKLLRKAFREASEGEHFAHAHELRSIELEIIIQEQSERRLEDHVERISTLKREALDQLQNLDEYESLRSRLYLLMNNRNVARRDQDIEVFKRIAEHELLESPEKALSVRARIEYHTIHAKLADFSGELGGSVAHNQKALEIMDGNLPVRARMLRRYFFEVGTLGIYLLKLGRYKEAFAALARFKELRENYPKVRIDYFPLYFIVNLTLAILLGEEERIQPVLEDVEASWNDIRQRPPGWHGMLLAYLMAYYYLNVGQAAKGLRWVNLIVNSPRTDQRIYLQGFARLLMLMIHFDLENYEMVENSMGSVQRFLEKHDRLHAFEETVLRSLRSMTRFAKTSELTGILDTRHKEFLALAEDEYEQRAFALLDFRQWLEAKVKGITISEIRKKDNPRKWPD